MEKDTAANAVSVAPICVGPIPRCCAQNTGKNESNVLCPALYRNEVTQMVATAAERETRDKHARRCQGEQKASEGVPEATADKSRPGGSIPSAGDGVVGSFLKHLDACKAAG